MSTLIGQLSQEEINELKKKHGGLNAVITDDHIGYFRPVTRNDVNIATPLIDRDNAMDFNYHVMNEAFVGGSRDVLDNDRFYLSALSTFKQMVEGAKVELVKL